MRVQVKPLEMLNFPFSVSTYHHNNLHFEWLFPKIKKIETEKRDSTQFNDKTLMRRYNLQLHGKSSYLLN